MSMAEHQQLLKALAELTQLRATVNDLKERLEVLERKAKESKTLSLKPNG